MNKKLKLCLLGHCRHGKDTLAEIIEKNFGLTFKSSSLAASEIFLYDALKDKYNYTSPEECFNDRVNHRAEWYELIKEYNSKDKSKLAKSILEKNDMYVGMREHTEIKACLEQNLFDYVIGVYDPRKPEEPKESFNINLWEESDFIITNSTTIEDLEKRTIKVLNPIVGFYNYNNQFKNKNEAF